MEITSLTDNEVEELDVGAALRLIAKNTQVFNELRRLLGSLAVEKAQLQGKIEQVKADMVALKEINNNLKCLCNKA